MSSRRHFLKQSGMLAGAATVAPFFPENHFPDSGHTAALRAGKGDDELLRDEQFWARVRMEFTTSPNIINLNNGGVSPQPRSVQEAHIRYYELCNEGPSYYMWRTLDQGRESLRTRLAALAGCSAEEIAINRNSTEGLNTVIFGLNLQRGDEVLLSRYDYPNMMNAWKQREKREGIRLNWIDPVLPLEDEDAIVRLYTNAITPATRVVHITHAINWTGQLVPVKKIAEAARAMGCLVIVDGAHSFAHIDYKIPDTGADFYATSLHKWLCAPFGSGLLYIRKNLIPQVWALLSNDAPDGSDIRKFESLGTRSFASEMAIGKAVDFHEMIGGALKEQRLRFLKDYWMKPVLAMKGSRSFTSLLPSFSCGIGHVAVDGWSGAQIEKHLFDRHRIHTVAIRYEKLDGVRITPHVYTSLDELDRLIGGFEEISTQAPPAE